MSDPLEMSPLNARLAELASEESRDRKTKAAARVLLTVVLKADLQALPAKVRSARVMLEMAAGITQEGKIE